METVVYLVIGLIVGLLFDLYSRGAEKKMDVSTYTIPVFCLAFSADGKLLATGGGHWSEGTDSPGFGTDGEVVLWSPNTGKEIGAIREFNARVRALAFSPDGRKLAIGATDVLWPDKQLPPKVTGQLRVWDVITMQEMGKVDAHEARFSSLAFSPGGKAIATGSADQRLRVWELPKQKERFSVRAQQGTVFSIVWARSGHLIATAGGEDCDVRLWDAAKGTLYGKLEKHAGFVNCLSADRGGRILASGAEDGWVKLWDLESGEETAGFKAHDAAVNCIAFSPDGGNLATGGHDGTVRYWKADMSKLLAIMAGHSGPIHGIAFSPDGSTLVSCGGAQNKPCEIKVWKIPDCVPRIFKQD